MASVARGWCGHVLLCGLFLASTAQAQPVAPMDFSAWPGDREATLQWADPQDADIERYEVRHGLAAVDDAGEPGAGTVRVTIPAREARDYTASQLETGNAADLSGALGDGEGKWRLRIAAPDDVDAMSLLHSPTGHITNLSTTPRYRQQ